MAIHHNGSASSHLPAEAATAWKQRITTTTVLTTLEGRHLGARSVPRINAADHVMTACAFHLDLSQWVADNPSRLGTVVPPRPIRDTDKPRPQRSYPAGYDPADIEAVFGG